MLVINPGSLCNPKFPQTSGSYAILKMDSNSSKADIELVYL
jgi:predicted phosphodiesterase